MSGPVRILTGPVETPDQMLAKLGNVLFELEDHHRSVIEYGALLTVLTTQDVEGDVAHGMNRLAWQIIDHGKEMEAAHGEMTGIVQRLRNP